MNCVLYARVSTDKQAEKDLSIPAQLQAMRDHASHQGWSVIKEFLEPGVSARTVQRPVLQSLLALIGEPGTKIDIVLVHKIDRFARKVFDHSSMKELFKKHGVRLASVVEHIDDSASGQLVENIMASFAEFHSTNLADEVKKGMRQKVIRGGWPHRPPRGYVLVRTANGRQNAIEIHPREGPLMRRAFELYASGWYSVKRLAHRLAKEGLVAVNRAPIPHSHLRRLLSSSFYAGKVRWHDMECQGTHPSLVSQELFDKVQDMIKTRYKNPGRKGSAIPGFPLRGLAVCATCRGAMTAERHHQRWGYYRCSRQTFRRELCSARMCNADRIHSALERLVKSIKIGRPLADRIAIAAHPLIAARVEANAQRQAHVEQEGNDLMAAEMALTQAFTVGDLAPNPYREQVAVVRARRQALGQLKTNAPSSANQLSEWVSRTLQLATSFWDLYEPMTDVRRASLLKSAFGTIVIDHEGITGFTLKAPLADLIKQAERAANPAQLAEAVLDAA
jgi:DNA invertase Pin-like site-specific DNA recombinase